MAAWVKKVALLWRSTSRGHRTVSVVATLSPGTSRIARHAAMHHSCLPVPHSAPPSACVNACSTRSPLERRFIRTHHAAPRPALVLHFSRAASLYMSAAAPPVLISLRARYTRPRRPRSVNEKTAPC
ncbi:hypothetical protein GGX14DRAFT_567029 [Mycena pura]|uniref:Uncharacterized protein n=1 Tax=Mycena pura TaxID=153505 RepID=A0AAD6VBL1_9AGAR|nr:hypothetical protein GGX14DRAFT_567029 [Mycena pura]